jgi:hypothetical protein
VTDAAASISLPLAGNARAPAASAGGRPPAAQRPLAGFEIVTGDYFRLMRIASRGRPFGPDDREGAPNVCIVNETFARHVFGSRAR